MEEENEDQMKQYDSFKDSHGNAVAQLKKANCRLEEFKNTKKSKEKLENEIY